ncbi:putative Translation initiation factor IF-2 [Hibiscus syriacus]|uniref:Translation initiation factor IF-2 n=1 Tax=Hibiscus syriacus TaxID=106335 RepID=A0A6A3CD64_HIBSY|nr:putative Translation initiation factor IF-2 [Hibiscus syriacus]
MGLRSKDLSLLQVQNNVEDDVEDVMGDHSHGEESESESESEQEDVKLAEPSKSAIYNREGLVEKLEDIDWPENVDWMHKLSLYIDQEKESMGLPFLRPSDYYAEMVKTDAHMQKVKGKLLAQKKQIEEAEERRKAREAKRIAKEVQAEKLKERAKQKKQGIEEVKKWRKQKQQSGFKDGKDSMPDFGFGEGGGKFNNKNKKNREFRDSKFGLGGRKGIKKQNTSETTNDLRVFNNGGVAGNKKRKR